MEFFNALTSCVGVVGSTFHCTILNNKKLLLCSIDYTILRDVQNHKQFHGGDY